MDAIKIIVWEFTPIWIGHLVYKFTGYLMAARFNEDGEMLNFYFQKESPTNFSVWPK